MEKANKDTEYFKPKVTRGLLADSYLPFSKEGDLLNKLTRNAVCLSKDEVYQGIVFSQNYLNRKILIYWEMVIMLEMEFSS